MGGFRIEPNLPILAYGGVGRRTEDLICFANPSVYPHPAQQ
jgi:hypothetical protein